jgi:hypothetical protein
MANMRRAHGFSENLNMKLPRNAKGDNIEWF